MIVRNASLIIVLCTPLVAAAQQEETAPAPQGREPVEVEVIGQRRLLDLRTQMWRLEKETYEIFNKFNDEERFNISCSMHQPTGTRIERQICVPEFQIQATKSHARSYYTDMRDFYDPLTLPGTSPSVYIPFAAVIESQLEEYKSKMRQVAEEHPEFLEALIRFSEIREQYENTTRTGAGDSE